MTNVVMVVDMLRGFYNKGNLANPRVAEIIPNIEKLLKKKIAEGWRVFFLNDFHQEDDEEFKMFPPHCVVGTEETEVVDELKKFQAMPNFTIPKTRYNGFYGTWLEDLLALEKPEKVILVGVCTDICVLYTAEGLRSRGYEVMVPWNCVETYDAPGHPADEVSEWVMRHMVDILGVKVYSELY